MDLLDHLVAAQGNLCYICGATMAHRRWCGAANMEKQEWRQRRATLDHVQPKSFRVGRYQFYAAACNDCNSRKGNRAPYPCELLFAVTLYPIAVRLAKRPWISDEEKMRLYHEEKMRALGSAPPAE